MAYFFALVLLLVCPELKSQYSALDEYVKLGCESNPSLRAIGHEHSAALQRIPQSSTLQDPTFQAGLFTPPMQLVDGRQIAQLQLMQMFQWPGVNKAAREERRRMAEMTGMQYLDRRNAVVLQIRSQWYALALLKQKQIIVRENMEILRQLETLALQQYGAGAGGEQNVQVQSANAQSAQPSTASSASMSGMSMSAAATNTAARPMSQMSAGGAMGKASTASLPAILNIQLEILEQENVCDNLSAEMKAAGAVFNALLRRPPESSIDLPDSLSVITQAIQTVDFKNPESNPMLGMIRSEALAYQAKAVMERRMSYPMFGIGFQYMIIGKTPVAEQLPPASHTSILRSESGGGMSQSMTNSMNGKDMIMPMISVSIPIYRNRYKAAERESILMHSAAMERLDDTSSRLEAALAESRLNEATARNNARLSRRQTALAQSTFDLLVATFASGSGSLDGILQVQRQLNDLKQKEAEAVAAQNTAIAAIMSLTGEQNINISE